MTVKLDPSSKANPNEPQQQQQNPQQQPRPQPQPKPRQQLGAEEECLTEAVPGAADGTPPIHADCITIIHFNDCYNVEPGPESSGAAGFLTAVEQYRHLKPLILFSGDIISPSFMSTFTKGEQMIPVLNKIGVDCAVFGNHEFDFGVDNLIEFTRRTGFPWLLSNVIDKETCGQLGDGQVYHIIERQGVRIGLIGLIEEEWLSTLSTLDPSDVIYQDFVERGRELARELKSEHHAVDYVIALTHSRTPNDCRLADSVPEIDLILGGHDHDYELIKRPNCYIVKSGTDFREFSLIKLKLNARYSAQRDRPHLNGCASKNGVTRGVASCEKDSRGPFAEIQIERIACAKFPPNEALKEELEKFVTSIDEKMGQVLGQFNCDLDGRFSSIRRYETNLGNFVTDIMLASTHADLAILNSGTLRSDRVHPRGDFTMRDLFNILGYIDPISVLRASGRHIWLALENGVSQWPKLEGRFPQISGCSFAFDPSKPAGQRIDPRSMTIGDEPLVLEKFYRLTTKAYLASGKDGYDVLKSCEVLVPGDESPDLTTSILNHFEAIDIVKSNRRTHHRQSIICLSRSSLKKLLDSQQLNQHHQNNRQPEPRANDSNNNCPPLDESLEARLASHDSESDGEDERENNRAAAAAANKGRPDESNENSDAAGAIGRRQSRAAPSCAGNARSSNTSTPIVGSESPRQARSTDAEGDGAADDDTSSPLVAPSSCQTMQQEPPPKPRSKRMMSLYEIEHEQCKLEPKVEGRIRILGVNA